MLAPNVVSLPSLISWLRTKNPEESYVFSSYYTCAFAQYLNHHGYVTQTPQGWRLFGLLHEKYMSIANPANGGTKSTFGQALERALQMQESTDVHQ